MSINSKMTAIADEIRELSGVAGTMGLDAMATNLGEANDVVEEQANLIEQISIALEEKINILPSFEEQKIAGTLTEYNNANIEQIGYGAFAYCSNLTTISFPVCTSIDSYAFNGCTNLTSASFQFCTAIGDLAFGNCSSLTTVDFPACTNIGSYAFNSCTNLTTVDFPACTSIGGLAFNKCISLTTISFPACISIGSSAFQSCSSLTAISFPACTTIGSFVFAYCYNLTSLYLTGSSLCGLALSNAFSYSPIGGYSTYAGTYGSIYVPSSLLTAYQTASNWSYFSSRFIGV